MLAGGCAASRGSRGESIPCLFQLLVAPGVSWLVAASLHLCLHLYRTCPHLPVSLLCMFLTRIVVIGLRTTWITQDDLISISDRKSVV